MRQPTLRRPSPWPLFLALLATATACAGPSSAPAARDAAAKDGDAGEEATAKLEHELSVARLELERARADAKQDLALAELKREEARRDLEAKRLEREAFLADGRQRELDQARLDLDRSRGRAEDAASELAELEAMYAAEEFASKTKELVLNRSRRELELSRRSLELSQRRMQALEGFELSGRAMGLEQALHRAERALLEAEHALANQPLDQQITLKKAEREVAELERKLAKEREKKAGKGKAETSDGQGKEP